MIDNNVSDIFFELFSTFWNNPKTVPYQHNNKNNSSLNLLISSTWKFEK